MTSSKRSAPIDNSSGSKIWKFAALAAWLIVLVVLAVRCGLHHHRTICFINFRLAGEHWLKGEYLYGDPHGFVYSPLAALLFVPFASVPPGLGIVLWQTCNVLLLLAGVFAIARALFSTAVQKYVGACCLVLIPLMLGNLDIGHSNPLLIGCIMLGIAAAGRGQWNWAALWIALATHLKIYPLAIGLLLCVVAPRRFTPRLAIALLALALLPFAFQHWSYVEHQYRAWLATRVADNRFAYPLEDAPLDLWFILHWTAELPVSRALYTFLQLGTAVGIAAVCAWGRWNDWTRERLLQGVFCLGCAWMMLFGPSTESYTYALIAPVTLLLAVQAYKDRRPYWLQTIWAFATFLQIAAVARRSLIPGLRDLWILTIQPDSALLIFGIFLVWLLRDKYWPTPDSAVEREASSAPEIAAGRETALS